MKFDVVGIRLVKERELSSEKMITSPQEAIEVIAKEMTDLDREYCMTLNLNNKNQVINAHVVSIGGITNSIVDLKSIMKTALLSNATGIMLFHNHPSGNCRPSACDYELTETVEKAAKLLELNFLDHIIVGKEECYSCKGEMVFAKPDSEKVLMNQVDGPLRSIDLDSKYQFYGHIKNERLKESTIVLLPLEKEDEAEWLLHQEDTNFEWKNDFFHLGKQKDLLLLNDVARIWNSLTEKEREKGVAYCNCLEQYSVEDLGNILLQTEFISYFPFEKTEQVKNTSLKELVGKTLADKACITDMLKEIRLQKYFDYKEYADDLIRKGEIHLFQQGYVDKIVQHPILNYYSKEDIKEHSILLFKERNPVKKDLKERISSAKKKTAEMSQEVSNKRKEMDR